MSAAIATPEPTWTAASPVSSPFVEETAMRAMRVASSEMMLVPPGLHFIPDACGLRRMVNNTGPVLSDVLGAYVQRVNNRGEEVFIEAGDHNTGIRVGVVHDIFFGGPVGGVRAAVTWKPVVVDLIESGSFGYFSPSFQLHGKDVIGFLGNCAGCLLAAGNLPAFAQIHRVAVVTQRQDWARKHGRFIDLLKARGTTADTLDENVAALRASRPDLAPAYDFFEAYKAEIAASAEARAQSIARQNAIKASAEQARKSTEFVRLVDHRASGGGKLDRTKISPAFDAVAAEHQELYAAWRACHS